MKDFREVFQMNSGQAPGAETNSGASPSAPAPVIVRIRPSMLTDLANCVWALQSKTCNSESGERKEEFRGIARHIDRLSDYLSEIGLQIQTHTNQPFDPGQSLEVIAFQPTPGLIRDIVVETIRPTVYLNGIRLQMGQVVVATPEQTEEAKNRA